MAKKIIGFVMAISAMGAASLFGQGSTNKVEGTLMLSKKTYALKQAVAYETTIDDEEASTAPGEKPSFTDGDLFSSLFEGPTRYEVLVADTSGPPYRVPVRLTYDGATPAVSWTDTALVVRENDRLVVGDIVFGGAWAFGNKGSLRKGLEQALRPH